MRYDLRKALWGHFRRTAVQIERRNSKQVKAKVLLFYVLWSVTQSSWHSQLNIDIILDRDTLSPFRCWCGVAGDCSTCQHNQLIILYSSCKYFSHIACHKSGRARSLRQSQELYIGLSSKSPSVSKRTKKSTNRRSTAPQQMTHYMHILQ